MNAEQFAELFHETYERLAPRFSYSTRTESARPWKDVPVRNRDLIIEVCGEIQSTLTAENKLLRDAINQQLAQLRDAERRCKAETAAKEAAEERADRAVAKCASTERAQGWIPVEEQLPKDETHTLISYRKRDGTNYIRVGYFLRDRWYGEGAYTNIFPTVTHWMPLPLSPIPSPAKPEEKP